MVLNHLLSLCMMKDDHCHHLIDHLSETNNQHEDQVLAFRLNRE